MHLFLAGHVALDLVNTLHRTRGGTFADTIPSVKAVRGWVEEAPHPELRVHGPISPEVVGPMRALRDDIQAAVDARIEGGPVPQSVLLSLTSVQTRAPAYLALGSTDGSADGSGVTAVRRRVGTPDAGLVAEIAEAAGTLLAGPDAGRIRQCAADDCILVFLAAHARRRWCDSATCGNRERVARHYERSRSRP